MKYSGMFFDSDLVSETVVAPVKSTGWTAFGRNQRPELSPLVSALLDVKLNSYPRAIWKAYTEQTGYKSSGRTAFGRAGES